MIGLTAAQSDILVTYATHFLAFPMHLSLHCDDTHHTMPVDVT
jgi:hypothetical protein